jgi:predicted short-subunit dehydrogenase-like oxidoreductase (DUF2520 family)
MAHNFSASFTVTLCGDDLEVFQAWLALLDRQEGIVLTRSEAMHYLVENYLHPAVERGLKRLAEEKKTPPVKSLVLTEGEAVED